MADVKGLPVVARQRGRPTTTAIDELVGRRVRGRRVEMGMSQSALAAALEITFQQIHKYECGVNRVGAGRLYRIAEVLKVPVGYFFSEGDETDAPKLNVSVADYDLLARRETLELVRAYSRIGDEKVRKQVRHLIASLARASAS